MNYKIIQVSALNELFDTLNSEKINYCILRNFEELPEETGNDIDFLIDESQVDIVQVLLDRIMSKYGFKLIKKITRFGHSGVFYCHLETGSILLFDLFTKSSKKWFEYADVQYILGTKIKYKNFYVPLQGSILYTVLLKDLLTYNKLREKNNSLLKNLTENIKREFIDTGKKYFDQTLLEDLFTRLKSSQELPTKDYLFKSLKNKNLLVNPFIYTYYRVKEMLWNLLFNKLYFIAIIGPDGVGKSTVTSNLEKDLKEKGLFKNILDIHHRFEFIPNMSAITHKSSEERVEEDKKSNVTNPSNIHSWYRTLVYHTYYTVDYILGYFYVLKYKAQGDLIVADRYFYDFFIQKHYDGLPRWVKKLFYILIPQPNILFFLSADAGIIYKRKFELTFEETINQNKRCEKIINETDGYIIDANQTSDQVNQQIKHIVFQRMASDE